MSKYGELLRQRDARLLMTSAFPARLAYGMISLAIYFKIYHATHSVAIAGLGMGLNGLAGAMTAGMRATLIDRIGLIIPLTVFAPVYSLGIIGFNFVNGQTFLILGAFALGIAAPPINISVRPVWKVAVPKRLQRTAFAIDTAAMSVSAIIGPPLATFLALSNHPSLALILTAVFMVTGGLCLASLSTTQRWKPEKKIGEKRSVLRTPAIRVLICEGIFIGLGVGSFTIAIPAIATIEKVPHRTGWILAVMAIFNVVGSLIAGLISKRFSSLKAFRVNYLLWILAVSPLALCHANWSLFLAGAVLGVVAGIQMVVYWEIIEAVRPQGSAAAALGWLWTFEGTAQAAGSSIGGWLSQRFSPAYAFSLYTITVIAGALVIHFFRSYLAAADRIAPIESEEEYIPAADSLT
jgi:MFS family permease